MEREGAGKKRITIIEASDGLKATMRKYDGPLVRSALGTYERVVLEELGGRGEPGDMDKANLMIYHMATAVMVRAFLCNDDETYDFADKKQAPYFEKIKKAKAKEKLLNLQSDDNITSPGDDE